MSLPDAAIRLETHELEWRDGAAGDVEVVDHVAQEPQVEVAARPLRTRDLLVYAVFGLLMIIGMILLLL